LESFSSLDFGFWIFLIIMGALAYITAISRQKTLRYTISIIEENLAAIKKDIAENRAKKFHSKIISLSTLTSCHPP